MDVDNFLQKEKKKKEAQVISTIGRNKENNKDQSKESSNKQLCVHYCIRLFQHNMFSNLHYNKMQNKLQCLTKYDIVQATTKTEKVQTGKVILPDHTKLKCKQL